MSDPPILTDKTKREIIRDFLEQGTPPQEIARMVGTSLGNVYKETAIFRKGGGKIVLTKSRKTAVTIKSESESRKISKMEKVQLEVEHNDLVSVPGLQKEEVKALYGDFRFGKTPAEILEEQGFHPEAVEKEHRRYLRMTGQDRAPLLRFIVRNIVTGESEKIKLIKYLHNEQGWLENANIYTLLEEQNRCQFDLGVNTLLSAIADTSRHLPDGCVRPSCRTCGGPIAGLLVLKNSPAERELYDTYLRCTTCRNTRM